MQGCADEAGDQKDISEILEVISIKRAAARVEIRAAAGAEGRRERSLYPCQFDLAALAKQFHYITCLMKRAIKRIFPKFWR